MSEEPEEEPAQLTTSREQRKADWIPVRFGLFDERPAMDADVKAAAASLIGVADQDRRAELDAALDDLCVVYQTSIYRNTAPSEPDMRREIDRVKKATESLRWELDQIGSWTRARLLGRQSPKVGSNWLDELDKQLAALQRACDRAQRKGKVGKPSKEYLHAPVSLAMNIWTKFKGEKFPITIRTAKGEGGGKEFTSAAAQFVYVALKGADASLTLAEIKTAIRGAKISNP